MNNRGDTQRMDSPMKETVALVALLRTRPSALTWGKLTKDILEWGSATAAWAHHIPHQLLTPQETIKQVWQAADDLAKWQRNNLHLVSVLDYRFPQRLLDIAETPPFLIVEGALQADDLGVSVVGSLAASHRGLEIAAKIAADLVGQGLTVISGLVADIDIAALSAAITAGGRAVAFLGTGSMRVCTAENYDLRAAIVNSGSGLVLSQFWPDTYPHWQHFLMRNALMSGYSLATIVVEADETNTARVQAQMALQHGRPVILTDFVVENNPWAQALTARPGVFVVSCVGEIWPIVDRIRSQSQQTDDALRVLAYG